VKKLHLENYQHEKKTPIIGANNHQFLAKSVIRCSILVGKDQKQVEFVVCPTGDDDRTFLIGWPLMQKLELCEEMKAKVERLNKKKIKVAFVNFGRAYYFIFVAQTL